MTGRILIIDTNVVVAGLLTSNPDSPTRWILDGMLSGQFPYLLSADLLAEYREVLLRPRMMVLHGLREAEIDQILTEIVANAVFRDPRPTDPAEVPDPGDAHLWALLACEDRAALVTGDKLLLDNPPEGGTLLGPMEATERFR
jgi:putative PIN family toxin of toxin-antitoxin system